MRCPICGRWRLLDAYAGEGGAGEGYRRAGFCVDAVDISEARLAFYRRDCAGARVIVGDAIDTILRYGRHYAVVHTSPPCTGYSQGTVAVPDRVARYDRLIPATRQALQIIERPYVIENVYGARRELRDYVMLCGRMFGLTAVDDDGTRLTLDRHRVFETYGFPLMVPEHVPHGWKSNRRDGIQVAGAYSGARRDKHEARHVRKGGYVPASLDVMRTLLGTPWMTETGCRLSIPPAYSSHIGVQILAHLERKAPA